MPDDLGLYYQWERTTEIVPIMVRKFAVQGLPTCLSWYGDDNHQREACQFLLTRHFGTIFVCAFSGADIQNYGDDENNLLQPPENCPIWAKSTQTSSTCSPMALGVTETNSKNT